MAVAELDMTPRLTGRSPKGIEVSVLRELGGADLSLLGAERGTKPQRIKRLRDRHHLLARTLASGVKDWEAAAITGYDISRVSILKSDPTFAELVEFYREHENAAQAEFQRRASLVTLTALDNLQEAVENEDDPLSFEQNLTIVKTLADRTGHAPVQRAINTTVNVDLPGRLSGAKARLAALAAKAVDADFVEIASEGPRE
jgi:hypothetical protein